MSSLLVRNIHTLATMDARRREIHDAAIYAHDSAIVAVGALADMPATTAGCAFATDALSTSNYRR